MFGLVDLATLLEETKSIQRCHTPTARSGDRLSIRGVLHVARSEYAFYAKRALADLPERYRKMYNITKEEIDLGNFK